MDGSTSTIWSVGPIREIMSHWPITPNGWESVRKQHSLRKSHPNHHNHFAVQDRFRFPAVTNALSCCSSPAAVRPNPLTTAPVPFRKKARPSRAAYQMPNNRRPSACGSATVVSLRLRSRRLSASASLSRSRNRRPKPSVDSRENSLSCNPARWPRFPDGLFTCKSG
jgi:hypothetical protein